jgi:hypothetical protein
VIGLSEVGRAVTGAIVMDIGRRVGLDVGRRIGLEVLGPEVGRRVGQRVCRCIILIIMYFPDADALDAT